MKSHEVLKRYINEDEITVQQYVKARYSKNVKYVISSIEI